MEIIEGIMTRRSVRTFSDEPVADEAVRTILTAGAWAPSGLNNQPWRFVVVRDNGMRRRLAEFTKYGKIIAGAPLAIALFIDRDAMYNPTKDHQGIGACAENMLLAAHGIGLGAVWLGEILNRADEVRATLELPERYELMAVIAVGHPRTRSHKSARKQLEELILREY